MREVHELKAQGMSNRAIAKRLGVTENAVRKLLRRLGWKTPEVHQGELPLGAHPNLSASSAAVPATTAIAPEETASIADIAAATAPQQDPLAAHPNLSASSTAPSPKLP